MLEPVCRSRVQMLSTRWVSVLLGSVLLASCAKPVPVPPPAPPPAPPPRAFRAVQPRLHAAWEFKADSDSCVAAAAAGSTRLELAVRSNGPIRLTVSLPNGSSGRPVARFDGPAGNWSVTGWHAGRTVVFVLGHDINALSRVLMMLSGGVLDLQSPAKNLPIVTLAPSGASGQHWFACARRNVI